MKKYLPWVIAAVFAVWIAGSLRPPPEKGFAFSQFGRLPLLYEGRMKPFDSLARNTLLQFDEKQTLELEPWNSTFAPHPGISAIEWLLDVMMKPDLADTLPAFCIHNLDLISLLGLPSTPDVANKVDGKHYSWTQIQPKFADLEREAERASKLDRPAQTPYDQSVTSLWNHMVFYDRLKRTLGPAAEGNLEASLKDYVAKVDAVRAAEMRAEAARAARRKPADEPILDWANEEAQAPLVMAGDPENHDQSWTTALVTVAMDPNNPSFSLGAFSRMSAAYRAGEPGPFNEAVSDYQAQLGFHFGSDLKKTAREQFFNFFEPFYKAMVVYVTAFLFVLMFWMRPAQWEWARRTAVALVLLGLVIHTSGLALRMVIQGRPPVTNLYSSAIFIGWAAPILGLVLEKFWRNSIGVAVSCIIGFVTLIIAHHLEMSGDTMEMMQAVLDSNLWLSTHVVVVTLGYASTYVAGCLGVFYILMGVFTTGMTKEMSRSLARMMYGIICFATLFSFVGTVLGGIWADQSWGRFWGWDPKENGALIIVLWNALILHARWGGLVRERGIATLTIVGNIVTSWSWWGVNMLGIGLHSYGFTSAAFRWLLFFAMTQLALIALGVMPLQSWKSFRTGAPSSPSSPSGPKKPVPAAG